jgi:protein-S-isoprenylcysteine O-methyltransferase Ste14
MPQKWHAAIFGALVPFATVVSIKRTSWMRWTFWTTLAACFVVNLLLLWIFFEFFLRNVTTFGWIWWVPVAFVEAVFLLHFQPKLERQMRKK